MANGGKRRLAALFGLSAVWLLALCAPALAHARLEETYPGEGDVLSEPPGQVQLRFNEPVEAEFSPVEVYDQQDNRVDEDDARVSSDDPNLLVTDLEELPEGPYTVHWRVTSADGHPASGANEFVVDPSIPGAGAGDPIEPVEQSAVPEEAGPVLGVVPVTVLGVLLIGALVVGGLVVLRRR
jgi:methionine-rich copper-binding protein CopC